LTNFVPAANASFTRGEDHVGMAHVPTSAKLLLIEDRRASAPATERIPVRRYRLARLRLDGRPADDSSRHEHLKRV
jgi:hypothetical protein